MLSLSEELLNASTSWFEIEETEEWHHRPLDEVSDLCTACIFCAGSGYYCGLSVNCHMVRQDINLQARRIWFGMPSHLKEGLFGDYMQSLEN